MSYNLGVSRVALFKFLGLLLLISLFGCGQEQIVVEASIEDIQKMQAHRLVAGAYDTCAIDQDGLLFCWGLFNYGSNEDEESEDSELVVLEPKRKFDEGGMGPLFGGIWSSQATKCAVTVSGELGCWGNSDSELYVSGYFGGIHWKQVPWQYPDLTLPLQGVWTTEIAVGDDALCAISADQRWLCNLDTVDLLSIYDENEYYGLEGPGSSPVPNKWTKVSLSENETCAIHANGSLYCYTFEESSSDFNFVRIGNDSDWAELFNGFGSTTCAQKSNGTLHCIGKNEAGQAGLGHEEAVTQFTQVGLDTDWAKVALGYYHACGIKTTGTIFCWGIDKSDSETSRNFTMTPRQVGVDSDWVDVVTGAWHTCGRKASGKILCWGDNHFGQLGNGTRQGTDRITPAQYYEIHLK